MHVSLYFTSQEPCKHNISNQCISLHFLKRYRSDSDTNIFVVIVLIVAPARRDRSLLQTTGGLEGGRLMTENVTGNGHAPKQINQSRQCDK